MVFALLIIYQIKHFVADYLLQGQYMLGKFKPYPHYILPLLAHTLVHGVFTFMIAVWLVSPLAALALGLLDLGIHFLVDRVKASPELLGRFTALSKNEMKNILSYVPTLGQEAVQEQYGPQLKSNRLFWHSLGLDQMAHHLTHYLIIWILT